MHRSYRFGEFELDLDAQQLRRNGAAVRLERRPFDLLVLLVENRERMVSRDEIVATLWPGNVIIDFESGLNTLVRKIRSALGDAVDQPRFIETVPGKGYRFIASVREPPAAGTAPRRLRRRPFLLAGVTLVVLLGAVFAVVLLQAPDAPPQTRIAILPFENLTGDDGLAYVAAGLAEETSNSLAAIDVPNLSVIGMTSTSTVTRVEDSVAAIGRKLDVDYVVLSSLRLERTRLRITSRLVRVTDGEQTWSATFDRELTNLLGVQRELSVAIAEQIRQQLSPDVIAMITARQTQNPYAFELYLKGQSEWSQFQPGSILGAIDYYRQAVDVDPEYALAWAGIAHALITSVVTVESNPQQVMPEASDALERALSYGPDLAETQLALGSFHYFLEGDIDAATAAARHATSLNPNSAMAHMFLGLMLSESGEHLEARAMMRRARELDPLFPLIFANSSYVALAAGDADEALELATQAVAINPEFWVGYLHRGNARAALGDYQGALTSFAEAERFSGNNSARAASARAYLLATLGREEEAREVLQRLTSRAAERGVRPNYVAVILVALGDNDAALAWLEAGMTSGQIPCRDLEVDERFEPLTADSRYRQLMEMC